MNIKETTVDIEVAEIKADEWAELMAYTDTTDYIGYDEWLSGNFDTELVHSTPEELDDFPF